MRKLLVANRGEIAVRILRTAKELGWKTVAVASDADARARHAMLADEVVPLGPSEPGQSYLRIDKVIDAAWRTGATALHPGYGFLSERPELAEACAEAGIVFVGPSPSAMRALGGKIGAKQLAVEAGVPVTPGFFKPGADREALRAAAERIGYPVMLKASAGGGGRGMRIVRDPKDFDSELRLASEEALAAFGDGAMMVEKLVDRPRHIEVQMIADAHGNVATLFERECSLQRRHQKLVEEAGSPWIARRPEVWERMREAVVALAHRAGYTNAGTVEFIVDPATGEFYFLEVNARLQVEHPVTELVTGLDLVALQLQVAMGEPLDLPERLKNGEREALQGHALEVRIVAEDPAAGFLPSIGKILAWAEPQGPGIRVDTGFGAGDEVSRFYDSLLAKVIVHAPDRRSAIQRMIYALEEFHCLGVRTNVGYLLDVLRHPSFAQGDFDTGFLAREFGEWQSSVPSGGLAALIEAAEKTPLAQEAGAVRGLTAWDVLDGFRNARPA